MKIDPETAKLLRITLKTFGYIALISLVYLGLPAIAAITIDAPFTLEGYSITLAFCAILLHFIDKEKDE